MKTRIIKQYNMAGEYIGDKEVFLSSTSIFGKHIENLGELKKILNEYLAELPDDTLLFYEKIDSVNGKIIKEPLLVEFAEASKPFLSFENGNFNKFDSN